MPGLHISSNIDSAPQATQDFGEAQIQPEVRPLPVIDNAKPDTCSDQSPLLRHDAYYMAKSYLWRQLPRAIANSPCLSAGHSRKVSARTYIYIQKTILAKDLSSWLLDFSSMIFTFIQVIIVAVRLLWVLPSLLPINLGQTIASSLHGLLGFPWRGPEHSESDYNEARTGA